MSEVPRSLTELKIQIGKDIHLHGIELEYGAADAYWEDADQVSDQFYVETADRWRAKCPDIAEAFGQAAERALLELPNAQGDPVAALLKEMIRYATDIGKTGSVARAFYALVVLKCALDVGPAEARQYLEALVAHSRGE